MAGVEPTISGNRTRTTLGTPGALIIRISLSTDSFNYVRNFQRFAGTVVSARSEFDTQPPGQGLLAERGLRFARHSRLAP